MSEIKIVLRVEINSCDKKDGFHLSTILISGSTLTPIAQILTNQRVCSGLCHSLPTDDAPTHLGFKRLQHCYRGNIYEPVVK